MFLRNYYNLMARLNMGFKYNFNSSEDYGAGTLVLKRINGSLCRGGLNLNEVGIMTPALYDAGIGNLGDVSQGIIFGTGNEPVNFDDYQLGTAINGKLTSSVIKRGDFIYSNGVYSATNKYTLGNSSNEELVIREYGLTAYNNGHILYFRELIEPYSLLPSDTVNVFLNYSYTMPTIDESGNVVAGSQAYGLSIE